jgi:hypothetical protein
MAQLVDAAPLLLVAGSLWVRAREVRSRARRDQTRMDPASFDECPGVFQALPRLAGEEWQRVISLFRDGPIRYAEMAHPRIAGASLSSSRAPARVVVIGFEQAQRFDWLTDINSAAAFAIVIYYAIAS